MRDTAFRTLDSCVRDGLMSSRAAETAETLCRTGPPQSTSWAQRWLAATGSRDYLGAFVKRVSNPVAGHTVWTDREAAAWREAAAVAAEQRAMGLVDTQGGFLIPAALDPAILLSGDGSTNPIRQVARVVQTTSEIWRGVTSEAPKLVGTPKPRRCPTIRQRWPSRRCRTTVEAAGFRSPSSWRVTRRASLARSARFSRTALSNCRPRRSSTAPATASPPGSSAR
ncbi:hypothetical protein MT3573.11 [Mycobacterium tuberculosis CDC1551]|uniref:Uncharacterized protein n=1 Tax=Mycobacterium tuberculosis (strain CDC 1551 / Oshkosh) TaxID=83331 RepID=Q8VJ00_MYCTO|nr:hypothetical protein MT3573.11 [Mycobacterium tuberculosis CDC1551]